MIALAHRSASRPEDDAWTIHDGALVIQLRGKGHPCDVAIDVCSERYPRIGCFVLQRLDEERWRVAPVVYQWRAGVWVTRPARYDERLPHEDLLLVNGRYEDNVFLESR